MRPKIVTLIVAGVAAALLAGCATTTAYQPAATPGGYGFTEQQIESNRVRVNFRGNSVTERDTVEAYLLYRAAELTLERGFDHFIVAERDTEARSRIQSTGGRAFYPGFYPRWSYFHPAWGWRPWYDSYWNDPISYRQVTQYEATVEVAMYRGPKPADNPQAFDARDVQANLQNQIVRPAPG